MQISTLYSKFQADDDAMNPALVRIPSRSHAVMIDCRQTNCLLLRGVLSLANQSVSQLEELLPKLGKPKIEILVDALVSRRLLRPFVVEGTMFWQIPT